MRFNASLSIPTPVSFIVKRKVANSLECERCSLIISLMFPLSPVYLTALPAMCESICLNLSSSANTSLFSTVEHSNSTFIFFFTASGLMELYTSSAILQTSQGFSLILKSFDSRYEISRTLSTSPKICLPALSILSRNSSTELRSRRFFFASAV